jgi:glycosyltransferase involved in cell wall biosynthesis
VSISVIVPTYNRSALLRRTLASLSAQTASRDSFEVVVGDDGSSDDTRDVVTQFAARGPVRYVFQADEGYRAAAARNAAARAATGDILAFLDTGTLAAPDFVDAHLAAHRGRHRTAVIGYTYGYNPWQPSTELPKLVHDHPAEEVVRRLGTDPGLRDMRDDTLASVHDKPMRLLLPWMLFWTCNVSVRAEDFRTVGGFDEAFRHWGGEDLDLGYRLVRDGVWLALSRDAWALEMPHERDLTFMSDCTARNGEILWEKYRVPVMELYWGLYGNGRYDPLEDVYRDFVRWRDETAGTRTAEEVAALAGTTSRRVLVVGADREPCPAQGWEALCPDEGAKAPRTHHAFGLRTPYPDGAFDVVVLTSRLAGIWSRWGELLLREAARVGASVVPAPSLRATAG